MPDQNKLIDVMIELANVLLESTTSLDDEDAHHHHTIDASEDNKLHEVIGKLEGMKS